MDLLSFLLNLVIGCLFFYCIFLLLNWLAGMMNLPAPVKTVVLIIFGIFLLLWIFGLAGNVPRIRIR